MGIVKTFSEFINESLKSVPRNSELFEKALQERGLTYADVFNRLKEKGLDEEFQDVISEFGIYKDDNGEYKSEKEFYAADLGKREPGEFNIDVRVGNIQEELFLMNNDSFKRNPKANYSDDGDFTKAPDFIFKPNDTKVEFAVSFSPLRDDIVKYSHRDSGFKYFLNEDKIIIIYFIKEDKIAVIGRCNCSRRDDEDEKEAKIRFENIKSKVTGKPMDVIDIKFDSLIDYDMFTDGENPEIRDKVLSVIQQNSNTPKYDFREDRYYRSTGRSDDKLGINLDKRKRDWKAENYNKCLRKWKELIKQSKIEKPGKTKKDKDARRDFVIKGFDEFVKKEGINKYTGYWLSQFSQDMPIE